MRRLLTLIRPFWRQMLLAIVLSAITIGSSVALMGTSAWLIARAAQQPSVAALGVAIVGVRAFGISRGLFRYLERLVAHEVTFRLLARFRVWFYERIEPLAPARLMQYRSGDLLDRVIGDVEALRDFFLRVMAPPVVALIIAIGLAIFLAFYHPLLSLIALLGLVTAGVIEPLLVRSLPRVEDLTAARAALNAALVDSVQGMAEIVAVGRQEDHRQLVQQLNRKLVDQQRRLAMLNGLHTALGGLITGVTVVLLLIVAIPSVDGLHLGVIVLATMAAFEAVEPLPLALQYLDTVRESAGRLYEIVDAQPMVQGGTALTPPDFGLSVQHLRFAYDETPVLHDISFELPPGKKLAIVGASGAGKSTLINLLLRFWDYQTGSIRLGGHDLCDYEHRHLLTYIGVMAQRTHLFNTTIRENLKVARSGLTDADIEQAARSTQIHEFIESLPDGYRTRVGEQGHFLSGGERQRLAIARTLLKDAPILILDEATANLDATTEREVMTSIHNLMEGRTVLMVTHRLVGLEAMDEILVLHQGRIAERGTHHDLLQIDGLYRRMWEQQNQLLRV